MCYRRCRPPLLNEPLCGTQSSWRGIFVLRPILPCQSTVVHINPWHYVTCFLTSAWCRSPGLSTVCPAVLGSSATIAMQDSATSQVENAKLEQVLSDCSVLVSRRPRTHFNPKDVEGAVEPLLKANTMAQHEHIFERSLACSALAALIKFSELGAKADNHSAGPRLVAHHLCARCPALPKPKHRCLCIRSQAGQSSSPLMP